MTDYPFLVKVARDKIVQAPRLRVSWREKRKGTRTIGGVFVVTEHAGWDRTAVRIQASPLVDPETKEPMVPVRNGFGRKDPMISAVSTPATAAGIKSAVRRLRPQEADTLACIDADIAATEQALRDLRVARKEVVTKAWANGHVVRLAEIVPPATDPHYVTDDASVSA